MYLANTFQDLSGDPDDHYNTFFYMFVKSDGSFFYIF